MNTLSMERKKQILNALVEGNSLRATGRMVGSDKKTVIKLLLDMGKKCQEIMDKNINGFHCQQVQVDEIWTFVGKKETRLTPSEKYQSDLGDQFVFVALDADTKLVPSYVVGKRDTQTALKLLYDLKYKANGNGRFQLSTDGFRSYLYAVEEVFGSDLTSLR